ncbi:hypothetical protein GQ600_15449 [Phytophthora cactorum]|nr:hypothetical protein GQ600_15449 [Phytophthora cactorum]
MNSKICFVALFAVVVTSFAPASAQPLRVCEPACGGQYSDQECLHRHVLPAGRPYQRGRL